MVFQPKEKETVADDFEETKQEEPVKQEPVKQ